MKVHQRSSQRRAASALRQLDYFFVPMVNGVGQCFVDDGLEQHGGLMLIQQHKLRINIGFDGKFMQQTRTEPMDRRDDRAFEGALMTQPRLTFITGGRA